MARKRRSKLADFLKTLFFLAVLAIGSALLAKQANVELVGAATVIDGDSIRLDGREIRLWGIDAPEFNQTCTRSNSSQSYSCGRKALQALRNAVSGNQLRCDGWDEDKYERLLAVCHVGDIELNAFMVENGWAMSYGAYEGAEDLAKQKKIGLWSGEFEEPSSWRKNSREPHSSNWLSRLKLW